MAKRLLLIAAVLLPVAVAAQFAATGTACLEEDGRGTCLVPLLTRLGLTTPSDGGTPAPPAAPTTPPDFLLAPTSDWAGWDAGAGLASRVVGLCEAASDAGLFAGQWLCMRGDGTSTGWDGGTAPITLTGTYATSTARVCTGFSNCTDINVVGFLKNSGIAVGEASTRNPTDPLTLCGIYAGEIVAQNRFFMVQSPSALTTTLSVLQNVTPNDALVIGTNDAGGVVNITTASTSPPPGYSFGCFSWQPGVLRYGINGLAAVDVGAGIGPHQSDYRYTIHGNLTTPSSVTSASYAGAFMTEKMLTSAEMVALYQATLGPPIRGLLADGGTVLVTPSQSAHGCITQDGGLSIVAYGPCIDRGRALLSTQSTQLLLRSENIDNAAWSDVATPTVTLDSYMDSSGRLTGDKIQDNNAAALEGRKQVITTTSQTKHYASCWFRCNSGSACAATMTAVGTSNSTGDFSCAVTGLSTAWKFAECESAAAYDGNPASVTFSVLSGDAVEDQDTIGVAGGQNYATLTVCHDDYGTKSFYAFAKVRRGAGCTAIWKPGVCGVSHRGCQ